MPPVDGFPFVYRDTVRFRDLDGMGHVNNAVFLTYMESARIAFLSSLGAGDNPQHSLILARMEVDFRSPIAFGEEVEVGVRPSRLGTKSFELEYELRADGRVAAEGRSVLVGYDYERGASVQIPAEWRGWLGGSDIVTLRRQGAMDGSRCSARPGGTRLTVSEPPLEEVAV